MSTTRRPNFSLSELTIVCTTAEIDASLNWVWYETFLLCGTTLGASMRYLVCRNARETARVAEHPKLWCAQEVTATVEHVNVHDDFILHDEWSISHRSHFPVCFTVVQTIRCSRKEYCLDSLLSSCGWPLVMDGSFVCATTSHSFESWNTFHEVRQVIPSTEYPTGQGACPVVYRLG